LAKALNLIAFGNEGNITASTTTGFRTGVVRSKTLSQPASRGATGLIVAGIVLLVVVAGFFLLRNQLFATGQASATPVPTLIPTKAPTEIPTEASTPTLAPTISSPQATEPVVASAIPFAPACAAGVSIPIPAVKETNKACITKIPYTSISIPKGATYESLDSNMHCTQQALGADGGVVVACTGQQAFSYQLKVCAPPVVSSADLGKCSTDSVFDSANQCCVAVPPEGAGCTTFKVDIRSCP